MTTRVVSVEMDDPLSRVKDIFDNISFHHLLVVEDDKLLGVISDRDLLKVLSPNAGTLSETNRDTASLNKRAHQIMTRQPLTLYTDATIQDAITLFNEHTVSCIPVVNQAQKPIGIISWRDILKTFSDDHSKQ